MHKSKVEINQLIIFSFYFYHACLEAVYADKIDTPRGFPCKPSSLFAGADHNNNNDNRGKSYENPPIPTSHQVSRNLFKITTKNVKNQHSLSTMFMTFGQFLDHDITQTPHESCKRKT